MITEIENKLDRINARVDRLGNTYARTLSDARIRGIATLKSLGWLQYGVQQSINDLKELNHESR